jgi:hypothetical protein
MTRTELIKELRTDKSLFVFTHWTPDDGVYVRATKGKFINLLIESFGPDELVTNASIDLDAIWIN